MASLLDSVATKCLARAPMNFSSAHGHACEVATSKSCTYVRALQHFDHIIYKYDNLVTVTFIQCILYRQS